MITLPNSQQFQLSQVHLMIMEFVVENSCCTGLWCLVMAPKKKVESIVINPETNWLNTCEFIMLTCLYIAAKYALHYSCGKQCGATALARNKC